MELNNGKLPRQKGWLVNGKWPKESIKFYEPELGVVNIKEKFEESKKLHRIRRK